MRYNRVLVYHLLLPSTTIEEGINLLEIAFQLLTEYNIKLNLKKCSFLKDSVHFLGHEIGPNGISPGLAKVETIKKFKTPSNVNEIRQFMGLTGYFRKCIKNFVTISLHLTKLTRKNVNFEWGQSQVTAFDTLKNLLSSKPILVPYNTGLEIEIHSDASSKDLGGILLQVQEDKQLKPVEYFSRVTSSAEQVLS